MTSGKTGPAVGIYQARNISWIIKWKKSRIRTDLTLRQAMRSIFSKMASVATATGCSLENKYLIRHVTQRVTGFKVYLLLTSQTFFLSAVLCFLYNIGFSFICILNLSYLKSKLIKFY